MTRHLQRGSSTTRFGEDGWSHLDTSAKLQVDDSQGENHGKDSMLSLLSGVVRRLCHSSHSKIQRDEGAIGFRNVDMPHYNSSLRSLLNGSHSCKGFFSQLSDAPSFSFNSGQSNSTGFGHSPPAQHKKVLWSPIAQIIMLSFISVFILVAVLGSSSTEYSSDPASRLIYSSHRKLQEYLSSLDVTNGGIFGLGALNPRELIVCPKDMEDHVPCYNTPGTGRATSSSDLADRHCDSLDNNTLCLIRPPKNYSLPLQWPFSKDNVWIQNTKLAHDFQEKIRTAWITRGIDDLLTFENQETIAVEKHFQVIADILGIPDDTSLSKIGVQTVLDIGCSYGAFVAHLLSRDVKAICIAPYETQNSHVQIALDRGLPAMIGSPIIKQLPYPASSFNMIHCANCGIDWSQKGGLVLLEMDRVLSVDGYFVWTMPTTARHSDSFSELLSMKILSSVNETAKKMCWASLPVKDQVFVWQKKAERICYTGSNRSWDACDYARDGANTLYGSLRHCLDATKTEPSISNQQLESLGSGSLLEERPDDPSSWFLTVKNYWSVMTPLLFSDHPKRPAEDDPLPPSNIVRNAMDMNALYGGFNSALLEAGKSVWVMNVVPTNVFNTLPIIYQRGLIGTLHDWCEAFPTYPRTYDLLHAIELLSEVVKTGCSLPKLLLEMDRILRPEGWVLLQDRNELIQEARVAAAQMRWEARIIEVEGDDDLRLLVCQKVFWRD